MAMNVLLWEARASAGSRELGADLVRILQGGEFEAFTDFGAFEARLRGPKPRPGLAVVWDPDLRQLGALEERRGLFEGLRILLVLSDDRADMVALAHCLRPAFVTYVEEGAAEVAAVVERLAESPGDGLGGKAT